MKGKNMDFDLDENDPVMEIQEATFGLSKLQQAEIDFKRYEKNLDEEKKNLKQ